MSAASTSLGPVPSSSVGPSMMMAFQENLHLREEHIAESCELHFNKNPMKIVSSKDQYLFDEEGNRYLDFVSRITNVGHCNVAVIEAACRQMSLLSMAVEQSGEVDRLQDALSELLLSTLPPSFEVVLYTNSGAEANDLALQMVRNYTKRHDLAVVDGAFHGTGNLLIDISPRAFKLTAEGKKPWVHVLPVPDMYRGTYCDKNPEEAAEKYVQDSKVVLERAIANNRKIAGFICEPLMVVHGVLIPPPNWLSGIYSYIHEIGGLVVADEIQCGFGRTGENFWAFQTQNAVPDILTIGKPMGNGHPIGAVITSRKIAATITKPHLVYKCDPVGATISSTVINVMAEKQLTKNASILGNFLAEGLKRLQASRFIIGDVRQRGIIVGVDIVRSKGSKKPAPDIAEAICNRMRNEKMLVGCEGDYKNVLLFLPALCITEENCIQIIQTLDHVVKCVELNFSDELYDILISSPSDSPEPSTSSGDSVQPLLPTTTEDPINRDHPYAALD